MNINKINIRNMAESELDEPVWRYLTFSKFASLLTYGALWFPKLNILQDQFEGMLTKPAEKAMHEDLKDWKNTFTSPEHHKMIDDMPRNNIEDGREQTVVNCWFFGKTESQKMWDDYVGSTEGLAIKSTTRKLASNIYVNPEVSMIGKVRYVDFDSYELKP